MVANAGFRGSPWFPKSPWTRDGFDPDMVVRTIRKAMLTATNALWVVTLRVDPPMDYVYWHPEEAWRTKAGGYVFGNGVHVKSSRTELEPIDRKAPPAKWQWPWVSMCSERWREETKSNIAAVIARLKETGLSRRIVGIHLGGFHDAQFATAEADYSPAAKAEFAASGEADYSRFLKIWPQRLIDEFAGHAKKCFGKDIIALRWCMSAFSPRWCSSHDMKEFLDSKHVDALVPQIGYGQSRPPRLPLGVKIPVSSLHLHGKLLMMEHDLYPWLIRDPKRPKYHDRMVGRAKNPDEWRVINRKAAGALMSRRMGWWYFDMGGGWYTPPEIAADIASTVQDAEKLYLSPPTPWRASAALAIDAEDLLSLQHPDGCGKTKCSLDNFVREIARSGVPFDVYLKSDLDARPDIAAGYRKIIVYDRNSELLPTSVICRQVRDAGGYLPVPECSATVDMNGDFLSLHALHDRKFKFKLPFPCRVVNMKSGIDEPVRNGAFSVELAAGETAWFQFVALDPRPET
jgi:hypothetical protein